MSESTTRARTRRSILDAAVTVLARDSAASLGEIATAAGVGRTTVHRYFAERSDLIAALAVHVLEQVAAATERAALVHGSPTDALERLCREYSELGDALTLTFNEPQISADASWQQDAPHDRELVAMIKRGQADGSIDPGLTAEWIQYMLWALLYTAWSLTRERSMPRHEAIEQCLRSLRKAVAAP